MRILLVMNAFLLRQYTNIAIKKNFIPMLGSPFFSKRVRKGYPSEMVKRVENADLWRKTVKSERVFTVSNGDILVGHLYERKNAERLVILFHGWRSAWFAECVYPAMKLYEKGASVLLVEQRAHSKSEGKYIGFGLLERYDCIAWCKEMARRFPSLPIYLMGFSMGASTLLLSAEQPFPSEVKGIVADSGYASPIDMVRRFARDKLHLKDESVIGEVNELCFQLAGYRFSDRTAREALKHTSLPILFVHGKKDTMVPYEDSLLTYEDCASKKELFLEEDAQHGETFFRKPDEYLQKISCFFGW